MRFRSCDSLTRLLTWCMIGLVRQLFAHVAHSTMAMHNA